MKAPHAILIGLSLIAAAIFFKDTMTPPANALTLDEPEGFACGESYCYVFQGDVATSFSIYGANDPWRTFNWRTGKDIE